MRLVSVRFACPPNAAVRRRAVAAARRLRAGTSRTFTWDGYLVRVTASTQRAVALVTDMPIRMVGFPAGLFRAGWNYPTGYVVAGTRIDYNPARATALDGTLPCQYAPFAGITRSLPVESGGAPFRRTVATPVLPTESGWLAAMCAVDGAADPLLSGVDASRALLRLIWRRNVAYTLLLRDPWLVETFGERATFATLYARTNAGAKLAMPTPVVFGEAPYYYARFDAPLPRQVCQPGMVRVPPVPDLDNPLEERVVIAAPFAYMPENQLSKFNVADPLDDTDLRWGTRYESELRAALPSLLITTVVRRDVPTADEFVALDLTFIAPDGLPDWVSAPAGSVWSTYGCADLVNTLEIPAADWPAHFQPTAMPYARTLEWIETSGGLQVFHSHIRPADLAGQTNWRSCVLGAVHGTLIDDQAEFWVAVRAMDEHEVPITAVLRSHPDDPIDPAEFANIRYTRTGIMRVRYNVTTGAVVVDAVHTDVLGGTDCPAFDAGTMAADVAIMPQVLWAGVLDGRRCYAVRAVRYKRDPWLGSLMQPMGLNAGFTTNYRGYQTVHYRPLYFTDQGFGPYIDDVAEELRWYVADDEPIVVPVDEDRRLTLHLNVDNITSGAPSGDVYPLQMGYYRNGWLGSMDLYPVSTGNRLKVEYALEEYFPAVAVAQQFTQIGPSRVVYFVPLIDDANGLLQLRVFDAASGTDTVYAEVHAPWVLGEDYTNTDNRNPLYALTCYQWESDLAGLSVAPASLLLTVSSGPRGYTLLTRDGGVTWERLVDADGFPDGQGVGSPGLGFHFAGTPLWNPPAHYPFTAQPEEAAP